MRALITGADGFLGANLCQYLSEAGHDVVGAALSRKGRTSLDALGVGIRVEYGDVCDRDYVERLVNATEAEVVIHLAAVSIVRIAAANPYRAIKTSVLGTLNVCEAGMKAGARVIVASSDKAYGDNGGEPYVETTPLRPTGAYEVSKAAADHIGRLYGAIVVRSANLYGPGDLNWSRLIPNSCRLALTGKPPEVYGEAMHYYREWLYVEDAVRAYECLAKIGICGEAYNIGSGYKATPFMIASLASQIAGGPAPTEVHRGNFTEIPTQVLDCEKVGRLGCWSTTPLDVGLRKTVEWYAYHLGIDRGSSAAARWDDPRLRFLMASPGRVRP